MAAEKLTDLVGVCVDRGHYVPLDHGESDRCANGFCNKPMAIYQRVVGTPVVQEGERNG